MQLSRSCRCVIALFALAACGPAFAAVAEPSAQTLCNAIGSEISVARDSPPASATKPKAPATRSVKPATRTHGVTTAEPGRGGGDATVEPRGRWKSFLPGTFK